MLTCFSQQLLYHEEKCPFPVQQSYTDRGGLHVCSSHFLCPSCLLWHSWEEFISTLWGKSVLPPPQNISRQCKRSHSSHCGCGCVCTVCMSTGMFRGTRTKCKPSAAIQKVESCQGSFWQPTGGYSRRTQDCSWWKSDYRDYSLCYRLAMCRMLQCVLTPSVLPQQTVSQG